MVLIELFALLAIAAVVLLAGFLPVFAAQIGQMDEETHNQTQGSLE